MDKETKVENLMGVSIDKIKQMVDVSTVVGDPIPLSGGHHPDPRVQGVLRLRVRRFRPSDKRGKGSLRRRRRCRNQHYPHRVHRRFKR